MKRRIELGLAALAFAAGCRTAEPEDAAAGVVAGYADDARRAAATAAAAPQTDSLTEIEAKVLAIRKAWDERLAAPERLAPFLDFTTPRMRELRATAAAGADALAAALGKELTLDAALAAAFERNPALHAAQRELAATIEQYAQVTYVDTILRQYTAFLNEAGIRAGMDRNFPFPGTLELKAAVVGHAVEAAQARYEGALRDLVTDVRVAYAEFVYLGRALGSTRDTLRFLEQLEATARGKLAAGTAEKSHVLQTQVEISALENDLVTLAQRRDTVGARLNALLDLPPASPLAEPAPTEPEPFPPALEPLFDRALQEQPDVRLAQARADRMATMIELAEKAAYPELAAGFEGSRPRAKPDPWFGSKEAYLRESREVERAARARVVAVRDHARFLVKDAYTQLDTARRLRALYRDVQLSQARQAYDDAAAGYAADRVEFLNVIDALRRWLRFLLDADRALRDYHEAHARLESAIGGPAVRKGK